MSSCNYSVSLLSMIYVQYINIIQKIQTSATFCEIIQVNMLQFHGLPTLNRSLSINFITIRYCIIIIMNNDGNKYAMFLSVPNSQTELPKISSQNMIKEDRKKGTNDVSDLDVTALEKYISSVKTRKVGQQRDFSEQTQITYIIENIFLILKKKLYAHNELAFNKVVHIYTELVKSKQNSRYYLSIVEKHLKEVLELELPKTNKKIYLFVFKIFELNPYITYKILQTKPHILQKQNVESLQLYESFIQFAASKKNNTLLLKHITQILRKPKCEVSRLKIVLEYYPNVLNVQEIIMIYNKINELLTLQNGQQIEAFDLLKVFVELEWSQSDIKKSSVIMQYIELWKNKRYDLQVESLLNKILKHLTITENIFENIKNYVLIKVNKLKDEDYQKNQIYLSIQIIIAKLGQQCCQQMFSKSQIIQIIDQTIKSDLYENPIRLLNTINTLNLHDTALFIHQSLKLKILKILSYEKEIKKKRSQSDIHFLKEHFTLEDKKLALRALQKFGFDSVQVCNIIKGYALKNNLMWKTYEFQKEVLKVYLHIVTKDSHFLDKSKVMAQIVNIIKNNLNLKIMAIEWFRSYQALYDKKIFQIFKEPEFLSMLFQDYSSNNMLIKRFSIKILCLIYPLNQCQIVPFLKKIYYNIYDRLSCQKLIGINEKRQALKLTREIIRHRTQIINDDVPILCKFLYNHLFSSFQYDDDSKNELLIQLFKTFIALVRKAPFKVYPYVQPVVSFIIKLLNMKDLQLKIKNIALIGFNQIIRNCEYVLLPYFHFPNISHIISSMLKEDDNEKVLNETELLRLLGNLGFISQDKLSKMTNFTVSNQIKELNSNFQKVFKQTIYLRQIKSLDPIQEKQFGNQGPLLYQKETISHTYIDINNYKYFIILKIVNNISETSSKIVRFKSLQVLSSFILVTSKEEEKMYQNFVLPVLLKAQKQKIQHNYVFELMSEIISVQSTAINHELVLQYLLQILDSQRQKHFQLIHLFEIVTRQYPTTVFKQKVSKIIIVWIVKLLSGEQKNEKEIRNAFKIIQNLSKSVNNLLHLFIPEFNRQFISPNQEICLSYFQLILILAPISPSIQYYLLPITETVLQLLEQLVSNSRRQSIFIQKIINFIICLIIMYGDFFKIFINKLIEIIDKIGINHVFYSITHEHMKKYSTLNNLRDAFTENQINQLSRLKNYDLVKEPKWQTSPFTLVVNSHSSLFQNIINQFNCDKNEIQEESQQWFNQLCIKIIENQTEAYLSKCIILAREDRTFCHQIFPLAIYFFWKNLNFEEKNKLTSKLQAILQNKVLSLRIKHKFIDTIYFMSQCQTPISITNRLMYLASEQVLDLAKALFYMERLFESDPQSYGQELIKMYAQLGQKQSAIGLLKIVKNLNTKTKIQLYQKLKRHFDALKEYDSLEDKKNVQNTILQITIRKQMSDWDSVIKLCGTQTNKNISNKPKLAHLAIEASINLGKWDQVKNWLPTLPSKHQNINLWKTMLNIYQKQYEQAEYYISEDRKTIYPKICQLFNFSFERRMEGIIRLQQLSELQEAITFSKQQSLALQDKDKKMLNQVNIRKKKLENLWNDRIEGSKNDLIAMQQLLMTRNLLLSKGEDINNWIDFCYLALKENQPQLSKKTLNMLNDEIKKEENKKLLQIQTLMTESKFILGEIKDQEAVSLIEKIINQKGQSKSDKTISKLYYKCALWLSQKQYDFSIEKGNKCIEMLKKSTQKMKKYIKGWHLMGLMHLKMQQLIKQKRKTEKKSPKEQEDNIEASFKKQPKDSHIFLALHCFINSVSIGIKNHGFFLEDCLKIMNIIFNEHEVPGLIEELTKNYPQIPSQGLIEIIPQIIGRLDVVEQPKILDIMKRLLIHIGSNHPQALVFPLVFLRKGEHQTRRKIADDIYKQIVKKQPFMSSLYSEAQLIVIELCKVSLKLNQKFKIFMVKHYQKSKKGGESHQIAYKYLKICKKYLKQNVSELSVSEFGFIQQYRQQLNDIVEYLSIYIEHNQIQLFKRAQKIIETILKEIETNLKKMKKLYLEEASPKLQKYNSSKICLPGSYQHNASNVYISSFFNELQVIDSKQRPKKLIIKGTNGKQYLFLLKGKEDLRLDQRIMQLFSLINKMFHDILERQNYSIQGYSITPLSLETGLIEWVQDCDTIGDLVYKYRKSNKGKVFLQKQISQQICQHSYQLPKAHKVEIYKEIENRISGLDLRNIFWIRSSSSQEWLKSRSCYTRSLAVMSMVGYIIGLGDRHPHNIMIQRRTGKIVHIDFGDCFDVNKMRKQFPERVPFRLTRMLVKAMQPCGINGIFKNTCEKIIKMLRNNKESIIAIIQAFRYDPLIGWRLKGKDDEQMLEHSFANNPTEESFWEQEKSGEERPKMHLQQSQRLNLKFAEHILNEIKKKLNGKYNGDSNKVMSYEEQVDILIRQAMSPQNLVQHYEGWSIYW